MDDNSHPEERPFLPFALPEIGDEEIAAVVACLRSGWDVGADLKLTHRADPNLTQGGALHF